MNPVSCLIFKDLKTAYRIPASYRLPFFGLNPILPDINPITEIFRKYDKIIKTDILNNMMWLAHNEHLYISPKLQVWAK